MRDFEAESFGVVVLASVTASVIGRAAFGNHPFLALPAFHLISPGGVRLLRAARGGGRAGRGRVHAGPVRDRRLLRPGLARPGAAGFLLVLLAGKTLATSLTIGIGGSGGVFAPSPLWAPCSAPPSATCCTSQCRIWPGRPAPTHGRGVRGERPRPITAVLIIFELTGDYAIVLPLMAAVVLAAGISAKLSPDTVYTLKLRRRGIDITRGRAASVLEILTVADAMQPLPAILDPPLHSIR